MADRKTRVTLLVLASLLGAALAIAQSTPDYSKVQIKATKVAGNVWELEGLGGNIAVLDGPDGLVMIDTEFAPLSDKIHAALKKIDGKAKLKFVINTHFHGDHTGGNVKFGTEATIIAQENVRKRLEQGTTVMGNQTPPAPKEALPVVTFVQEATLHLDGEEIRIVHYANGHTDGDSVVYFTHAKVIHMGDQFVNGSYPFVDVANGGDVENEGKNDDAILATITPEWKVIPGHGPLGTYDQLQAYRKMLADSVDLVKKGGAKAGMPAEYDSWGKSFIDGPTWIGIVDASLKADNASKK